MAKQPWEVPDIPQCGDASQDDTFRAVGAALSQWELFEGNLSLAFSYFVGTGYGNIVALRAYGSVETFRGRANMIETAAEVYFKHTPDPQLQVLLKEILKQSRQFSSRRNEVVHGIVSPFVGRDEADEWINLGFVLYPAYYAKNVSYLHPFRSSLWNSPFHIRQSKFTNFEIISTSWPRTSWHCLPA
jgi:hypothetical protein